MGKRVAAVPAAESQILTPLTRTIRKRKRNSNAAGSAAKALRLSTANNSWHENDDEDSSSNDACSAPARNLSSKHANNSSILLNLTIGASGDISANESPKPVYALRPSIVNGTILYDLTKKPWRLGRPIGKGNFGEIFLASDNITIPVTNENAKFVVKIEPHSNGPLFVEIHCLMNTAKKKACIHNGKGNCEYKTDLTTLPEDLPSGIPDYIASGSHYFGDARYRFLVLQRFDRDLHSLIKNSRVPQKCLITLAIQIVNVLESLHDKGYCHNDVKAQNLMISKCKYLKQKTAISAPIQLKSKTNTHYDEKQLTTTDSGNSSEQEAYDEGAEEFVLKRKTYHCNDDEDDEDFDDGTTSNNSNSIDMYQTPVNTHRKRRVHKSNVEFSGSNPVRSCRRQKRNSIYEEMVKSHYLRPTKRVSYAEFFNNDGTSAKDDDLRSINTTSSEDETEEFLPHSARRSSSKKSTSFKNMARCLTRRQEKLLTTTSVSNSHNNSQKHKQQEQQNRNRHHQKNVCETSKEFIVCEEDRIFLIDFGLASKFRDNGVHRPFIMDQRRAHDGTLEFTSRDAHMGAHSRRSDLECLGYNLLFWSQGYLPWQEAATQHQPEKVHRAKEYIMTDVRDLLIQIYGNEIPKYLGEFLHHVSQLAYHDRPDYARYRRIFQREFQQRGYSVTDMRLDSEEIKNTCVRVKEEMENKNDIFELKKQNNNVLSIMKNISVGTPFFERTLSNRVSPKNLRSKSGKKSTSQKKKFSWAEILSQDPDQIARERAEKEFDREEELIDTIQHPVRRYSGKPTYAILEIQQRLKLIGRLTEINWKADVEIKADRNDERIVEEDNAEKKKNNDNKEEKRMKKWENEMETEDENVKEEEKHEYLVNSDEGETDASEESEQYEIKKRNKCRSRVSNKSITSKRSPPRITSTTTKRTRYSGKRDSLIKSANKKHLVPTIQTANQKRCGTRHARKVTVAENTHKSAASEAGEVEHNTRKCVANVTEVCGNGGGAVGITNLSTERRTRRCLIKTDVEVVEEEESNSSFSPDVGSLFNVWKKINNESIYFRGSNTAARHGKK